MTAPPQITSNPASQTVVVGTNVTFSVIASGTPPLRYAWLFNGAALAGQTNATLTLTNVQTTDAGSYTVVVSNAIGTVTSLAAVLRVNLPPTLAAHFFDGTFSPTNWTSTLFNFLAPGRRQFVCGYRNNGRKSR